MPGKPRFLHQSLTDKIGHMIESGTLRAGERVPSVRRTATAHGVSLTTAVRAYLELENRGLIEARPKSGFFVRNRWQDRIALPAATLPALRANAAEDKKILNLIFEAASRPDIIPLGAACPSPELLPVARLSRLLSRAARERGAEAISYAMPPGYEPLRRHIAQRSSDSGCALGPEEVIITNGCMDALNLALQAVTKPGDTVVIESPVYYGIVEQLANLGLKALEIPTDPKTGLDLDALETELKTTRPAAVLVVSNFSNPLGSCMPDSHKERLVTLLAKREIPLIEDDIYGDLVHHGNRPRTAKSYDRKGLVLLCSSFSKTLAPGYRVGWICPGRWFEDIKRRQFASTVSATAPTQLAIDSFLTEGGYDHHLRAIRRTYASQVARVSEAVAECFPEGVRITRPEGGFVLWVEMDRRVDAVRLHRESLDENVSIVPGPIFSTARCYGNFIRLSCGFPWSRKIDQAIAILGHLVKRQMG
jgi:DNA-binding transcriptional MocR family regulator